MLCTKAQAHIKACHNDRCATCFYIRAAHKNLLSRLKFRGEMWLKCRFHGTQDSMEFKCAVCTKGLWSRWELRHDKKQLQISNLLHHQEGYSHRVAMARQHGLPRPVAPRMTPSEDSFKQAILERRKNGSAGRAGHSGKRKLTKILFCVREAERMMTRRFLAAAESIAISQDVAGKRLLMRYRATTKALKTREGYLGSCHYLEHGGSSAIGVAKATRHIVRNLCTPWVCPPPGIAPAKRRKLREEMTRDKSLEQHIRDHTELVTTDGAADEVLAGRLLRSGGMSMDAYFPKLLLNKRDATHAVKRTCH